MANITEKTYLGMPGKWIGAVACAQNTTTNFTGSNFKGAGAIYITHDAARNANNIVTLSDGSSLTFADIFAGGGATQLNAFHAVELSIAKVVIANTSNFSAIVLIRNPYFK